MTSWTAYRKTLKELRRCLRLGYWIWLASFALALVPALVVSQSIEEHLGRSIKAENLSRGYDDIWYQEFDAQAEALASTFDPTQRGGGAIFSVWDDFINGQLVTHFPAVAAIGILYALLWTFFSGGILAAFESPGTPTFQAFIASCGRYFGRFFRLFILAGLIYLLLQAGVLRLLIAGAEALSREVIDERVHFAWVLLALSLGWGLIFLVNLTVDYTRAVTLLEGRRSMFLAAWRARGLVFSHLMRTLGLYLLCLLSGLVLVVLYTVLAPGAGQSSWWGVFWALLLGQLFIFSKIVLRMLFLGSSFHLAQALIEDERQRSMSALPFEPTPSPGAPLVS